MNEMLLTLIAFFPLLGMLVILCLPDRAKDQIKTIAAVATGIPLLLSIYLYFGAFQRDASMQLVEDHSWITAFNIRYILGVDGLSLPLVFLTCLLLFIAVFASWKIDKGVKGYFALLLLLEIGINGTFLALDFFLFYVFWEIMLLPMYFLIGIWGGPRKEYAAIKFFLYTLAGSVLMLVAMVALYLAGGRTGSDLVNSKLISELRGAKNVHCAEHSMLDTLLIPSYGAPGGERVAATELEIGNLSVEEFLARSQGILESYRSALPQGGPASLEQSMKRLERYRSWVASKKEDLEFLLAGDTVLITPLSELGGQDGLLPRDGAGHLKVDTNLPRADRPTFDIRAMQAMGQENLFAGIPFAGWGLFGLAFHQWIFIFLFIGFAIKIPVFPFHTWLPDAHVEAPTAISVILAGILLKLGAYGMLRINFPVIPGGFHEFAYAIGTLGIINIVYGAFVAMAQKDFKRLVAYSSVSHMGYVLLGMAALTELGMNGATLQLFNHGTSSAMLFLIVGVIYDRAHHRDLNGFGGLMKVMPYYGGLTTLGFFAALGLPGLAGFISEAMTLIGAYQNPDYRLYVVIALVGIVITAAFLLWTMQRVFLGPLNEKYAKLPDINAREIFCQAPLAFLCIILGVVPWLILAWMTPAVNGLVHFLQVAGS